VLGWRPQPEGPWRTWLSGGGWPTLPPVQKITGIPGTEKEVLADNPKQWPRGRGGIAPIAVSFQGSRLNLFGDLEETRNQAGREEISEFTRTAREPGQGPIDFGVSPGAGFPSFTEDLEIDRVWTDSRFDGLRFVCTNTDLPAEEALANYRRLRQLEEFLGTQRPSFGRETACRTKRHPGLKDAPFSVFLVECLFRNSAGVLGRTWTGLVSKAPPSTSVGGRGDLIHWRRIPGSADHP
jgi:hypothetical protein